MRPCLKKINKERKKEKTTREAGLEGNQYFDVGRVPFEMPMDVQVKMVKSEIQGRGPG